MPSVALLFYCYAKLVLTEKQTFRNEISIIILYKIRCLQHNGKVIEILTKTESLLIFYFRVISVYELEGVGSAINYCNFSIL